jgi:hypothetical protein
MTRRQLAVALCLPALSVAAPAPSVAEDPAASEGEAQRDESAAVDPSSPPAVAGPRLPPIDGTLTSVAGWHSDREYAELFGRLNLAAAQGPWQAALRLDTATFVNSPDGEIEDRYTLEKASLGWTSRSLDVTAGDTYVSFGRGLGLSLRKLDELGIDTTLRGAKALLDHGRLSGTLAVGYANINNVDEATGDSVADPYDLIGGLQGKALVADWLTVGGYGAAVAFRDPLGLVPIDSYTDRSLQVGLLVEAPRATDRFGFYLEAMAQEARTVPEAEHPRGLGLYGTATGYLGKITALFEGKAYVGLTPLKPNLGSAAFDAVAYNNPPTVERVLQVIENPPTDVAGGRFKLDWSHSPRLLTYVNLGVFRDWLGYADPGSGEVRTASIVDPWAGAEVRWDGARSWALFRGGWRAIVVDGSGAVVRQDGHVELDVAHALGDRFSLTFHGLHEERAKRESMILDEEHREGSLTLGCRLQPSVTIAAGYDYTTESTQPKRDYWNANLGWDLTPSSGLRLFVGSARGGLRCVSGVCRIVPPFEGVKLTATLRF